MRLASFLSTVFPHWAKLHVDAWAVVGQQITIDLTSTQRTARCPACQQRSHRAHSHFTRLLTDLPLGGYPLCIRLHARRFRCGNPACTQQTFRECLPAVAPRYQRRPPALQRSLEAVGFALGGQAGRRLARCLQLGRSGTSRNSLLRLIRRWRLPSVGEAAPHLRVLGVDDFAFRRGLRYGALLVDLEQHRVLDLLPDREAATLAEWLHHLPHGEHLEVISRDRGGAFADGARQGAPQAVQVADRFHVVRNLGQVLDRLLIREHRVLTRVAATVPGASAHDAAASSPAPPTRVARERAAVDDRRQARYACVVALGTEGYSLRAIARRTGVSRETVRSYLSAGQYRPRATRRRPRGGDRYAAYLRQRWEEGEHNSAALLREIQARGYTGSASTLRQYVRAWRSGSRRPGRRRRGDDAANPPADQRPFSPRQTHWLLVRPVDDLTAKERAYCEALCQGSVTIATAQRLVVEFGRIIRTHARADLDPWLADAAHSRIPELVSFVCGVRRDYDAVAAALISPHSQGQVEGHVNRIKLLKRQSFGRANFDLLRRRVFYNSA